MGERQPNPLDEVVSPLLDAGGFMFFGARLISRSCVALLICVCCIIAVFLMLPQSVSRDKGGRGITEYSGVYFFCCFIGGILSGIPHTLMTPVDLVKCRMQVGEYATVYEGFHMIYRSTDGSLCNILPAFFRGWVPTFIGYSLQGGLKFFFYEVFKFALRGQPDTRVGEITLQESSNYINQIMTYLAASFFAEMIADVALAPWEVVKIKIQTTSVQRTQIGIIIRMVWAAEGCRGFYKGLAVLWCRQVPYTVVKFMSFETIVNMLYNIFLTSPQSATPRSIQLLFSLIAGVVAGVLCAIVSHPADTIVSKLNQRVDSAFASSKGTIWSFMREIGWSGLWKGVGPRLLMVGTLTAMQWLLYDTFKVLVGIPATGGGGRGGGRAPKYTSVKST